MALPVALEQLIGVERLALLREVALVPRDLADVVPRALPGEDVVVLVHGFFASAGVFRPLRARLEREAGARVATFTHAPGVGIRRIARRLARLVDKFPSGTRITVVGHSLGGIVARWYVQEMGGHERVARTVSLASPFGGIDVPPLLVGADLHEQSELLRRLRFRVTLNTDNRLMSDVTMSSEMGSLCEVFGWGFDDLEWLTLNAMKSAFCPFDKRLALIDTVIKPRYAQLTAESLRTSPTR